MTEEAFRELITHERSFERAAIFWKTKHSCTHPLLCDSFNVSASERPCGQLHVSLTLCGRKTYSLCGWDGGVCVRISDLGSVCTAQALWAQVPFLAQQPTLMARWDCLVSAHLARLEVQGSHAYLFQGQAKVH